MRACGDLQGLGEGRDGRHGSSLVRGLVAQSQMAQRAGCVVLDPLVFCMQTKHMLPGLVLSRSV